MHSLKEEPLPVTVCPLNSRWTVCFILSLGLSHRQHVHTQASAQTQFVHMDILKHLTIRIFLYADIFCICI